MLNIPIFLSNIFQYKGKMQLQLQKKIKITNENAIAIFFPEHK